MKELCIIYLMLSHLICLIKIYFILIPDVDVFFRQSIIGHDSQSNGVNGDCFRFALFRFTISVGRHDRAWSSQTCLFDEFAGRKFLSFNEILLPRFSSWGSLYAVAFPSISINFLKIYQYNNLSIFKICNYVQIYLRPLVLILFKGLLRIVHWSSTTNTYAHSRKQTPRYITGEHCAEHCTIC